MILDFIIGTCVLILTGFLALVPAYDMPSLGSFGGELGGSVAAVSGVFPVATLGLCLAAMLLTRLFVWGFGLVVWLYDRLPFKFT